MQVSEILGQTAAFAGLKPQCYGVLAAHAAARRHARGDIVFAEDSSADGLYLIVQGCVRLTRTAAPGRLILLSEESGPTAILTSGFLNGTINSVTATAVSDCSTVVIDRDAFNRVCKKSPEVAVRLLSEIAGHLCRTSGFIDLITATDTRRRVARALLDLMEESGSPEFVLPCSHANLANRLGTVREVVFRNLKSLERQGILRTTGLRVTIHDPQALSSAAGVSPGAIRVFEPRAAPPIPAYFVLHFGGPRTM